MSIYDDILKGDEELENRMNESYNKRDEGGKYGDYFRELPFPKWKRTNDIHTIDILPWAAGKDYPGKPEGSLQYVLVVWVHQKIGYKQQSYVCPQMNYGKPCPICEKIDKMTQMDGYDAKLIKEISPKKRCVYYILSWGTQKDARAGVQIWESSHWHSEKAIITAARTSSRGGMVKFYHPLNGKTLRFDGEGKGIEASPITFLPREDEATGEPYEIDRETIEGLEPLDSFLDILSYEELSEVTIGAAKPREYDNEDQDNEIEDNADAHSGRTVRTIKGISQRATSNRSDRGVDRGGVTSRGRAPMRDESEPEQEGEERSVRGGRVSNERAQSPQRAVRGGQLRRPPVHPDVVRDDLDDDIPF
jgi:hypothetical protein